MNNSYKNNQHSNPNLKAVGLISGGLDSALAVKILQSLGIQVYGIFFDMPWRQRSMDNIKKLVQQLHIPLNIIQLDENYLEMVRKPRFGRGIALNPCMDCHVYMLQKASQYMNELHADFIFTGEVLGQRPMSQNRSSLNLVERKSGLKGKLLRPLSASLLEPTDMENEGKIERAKLLSISGRGRREQLDLAQKFDIQHFAWPAGGCLLTDKHFSKRLEDLYLYGYRNINDVILLKWGRHFRINETCKFIISKDERESNQLLKNATSHDYILEFPDDIPGPTVLAQTSEADINLLSLASGYLQYFSKFQDSKPQKVAYRLKSQADFTNHIIASRVNEKQINATWIR